MASWGNRAEWKGHRKGTLNVVDLRKPASQRFLRKTMTHKAQWGNRIIFRFHAVDFIPMYSFSSQLTPTNNVYVIEHALICFHISLHKMFKFKMLKIKQQRNSRRNLKYLPMCLQHSKISFGDIQIGTQESTGSLLLILWLSVSLQLSLPLPLPLSYSFSHTHFKKSTYLSCESRHKM